MTRGAPDYSNVRAYGPLDRLDDMAELAVRLGAFATYDRRGNIIWMDDFNNGLEAWTVGATEPYGSVEVSAQHPKWPPYCVKMVAGGVAGDYARMINYQAPPTLGAHGLELSVNLWTAFDRFEIYLQHWDGNTHKRGAIIFDRPDGKIYYSDANGDDEELDDLSDAVVDLAFYNSLKMVVNFETTEYVRFMVNHMSYDMSGIELHNWTASSVPQMWIMIYLWSLTGAIATCYIDGMIVTQNEP